MMDFEMVTFMLMIESFVRQCAPYACIGPNAAPDQNPSPVVIEQTSDEILPVATDPCTTWRNGIEMSCEQGVLWDKQKSEKDF